jgi:ribosomal protein L12E/L44/L45/RPP1/RPP2
MIKALSGKKLHDLVRDGSKKLASGPAGVEATAGKEKN